MKLSDLSNILYSLKGWPQQATVYDTSTNEDIDGGVVDSMVERYADREIVRIEAFDNILILVIK